MAQTLDTKFHPAWCPRSIALVSMISKDRVGDVEVHYYGIEQEERGVVQLGHTLSGYCSSVNTIIRNPIWPCARRLLLDQAAPMFEPINVSECSMVCCLSHHKTSKIKIFSEAHADLMNRYLYPYLVGFAHKIILPYMDRQPRWVGSWKDAYKAAVTSSELMRGISPNCIYPREWIVRAAVMAAEAGKPDPKISFIQPEGERGTWRLDEEELAKARRALQSLEEFLKEREDESATLAGQLAEREAAHEAATQELAELNEALGEKRRTLEMLGSGRKKKTPFAQRSL